MRRALVIPAAGRGSRLGADGPKALAEVAGRPMLGWLLERYRPYVERFVVVASPDGEAAIRQTLAGEAAEVAVQETPTGMLDAILIGVECLRPARPETVWATWCDQVGVTAETAATLAARDLEAPLVFPTMRVPEPYIHFERSADGRITKVLQRREGDRMPAVGETDMGLFSMRAAAAFDRLPEFAGESVRAEGTGERNYLPFIPWLNRREDVVSFSGTDRMETLGVNTPEERARMEAHLLRRGADIG